MGDRAPAPVCHDFECFLALSLPLLRSVCFLGEVVDPLWLLVQMSPSELPTY